ncbi:unnamed protein product [Cylicostephanus goldi]|uniref:EB domain-containing protein n=1 Tax=Cylicostephanus goldi TaxID=71465 RepID=A0A3P7MLC2_CYLGO|nr:unnamed protein product [Cylicostephanus goldi]
MVSLPTVSYPPTTGWGRVEGREDGAAFRGSVQVPRISRTLPFNVKKFRYTEMFGFCIAENLHPQCPDNEVLLNGKCVQKVPIGSPCQVTQQCLGGAQCNYGLCQCAAGQSIINGVCSGGPGSGCPLNQRGANKQKFLTVENLQVMVNGQCMPTVGIGLRCSYTQQCLGNSVCVGNVCQCPSGSNNYNGKCTSPECQPNQVTYILHILQCIQSYSEKAVTFLAQNNVAVVNLLRKFSQLLKKGKITDFCSKSCGSLASVARPARAALVKNTQKIRIFVLWQSHFYVAIVYHRIQGSSHPSSAFEKSCEFSSIRLSCGSSAQLLDLLTLQILVNNQCLPLAVVGGRCTYNEQCTGNSECANGYCRCSDGSAPNNGICNGQSSACKSYQVGKFEQYSLGQFVSVNNQCLDKVSIGQSCTNAAQCIGMMTSQRLTKSGSCYNS